MTKLVMKILVFVLPVLSLGLFYSLSFGDAQPTIKAQAEAIDYSKIYSRLLLMQNRIGEAISVLSLKSDSPIPYLTNEEIAEWFGLDSDLEHKEVTDGISVISRDENDELLIKRDQGYLRVIDKTALQEDRDIGLDGGRTLSISEEDAFAEAERFIEAVGIPEEDLWRADIKMIVGEAGDGEGNILQRDEAEYLVTYYRKHKDIPVSNSMLRFTIGDNGKIKRILARWPELELKSENHNPIDLSKVAEEIYEQLDAIYYKYPIVKYSLMPVIHHEVSDGVLYAEPVIRVMAVGTSEEISHPIVVFYVRLVE